MVKWIIIFITGALIYVGIQRLKEEATIKTDVTAPVTKSDQDYYITIFNYVMDNRPAGVDYPWASYAVRGSITAAEPYTSKSGSLCRAFTEYLYYQNAMHQDQGIACRRSSRSKTGWCRIRPEGIQTCALETPAPVFDMHLPAINARIPGVNIDLPEVQKPNKPNTDIPTGEMPQRQSGSNKPGAEIADKVTGHAGTAGGEAVGGFISWFAATFR